MGRRVRMKQAKGRDMESRFRVLTHSSTLLNICLLGAYNMTGKGSERDRLSLCLYWVWLLVVSALKKIKLGKEIEHASLKRWQLAETRMMQGSKSRKSWRKVSQTEEIKSIRPQVRKAFGVLRQRWSARLQWNREGKIGKVGKGLTHIGSYTS